MRFEQAGRSFPGAGGSAFEIQLCRTIFSLFSPLTAPGL